MCRLEHGSLVMTYRRFTAISTSGMCPFCSGHEDTVPTFPRRLHSKALPQRIASPFGLTGVPFQTVHFLHPLPKPVISQFVLLVER